MKKVMFITHQLTRTGAPIVMMEAVRVFLDAGCSVQMISMSDGELRSEVEALSIPLQIRSEFMTDWRSFLEPIWDFDLVFVNTIVPLQTIHLLNLAPPQVVWWLHEPEVYFDVYGQWLPNFSELKPHVHVWAVSPVVRDILKERYAFDASVVPFGIKDAAAETARPERKADSVTFLTVGIFSKIKGQDVAQKAISLLPEDIRETCRFIFCGDQEDTEPEIYEPLHAFAGRTPHVSIIDPLPHPALLREIASSDYLLIPSRREAMPTVAAEAMMLSVPSVISDACGMARYMEDGKNGLLFPSEDAEALSRRIADAVRLRQAGDGRYERLCAAARARYEEAFSFAQFQRALLSVIEAGSNPV